MAVRLVVHRAAEVDAPRLILGYILGLYQYHAARVVGGVFGCGRLDNHQVIELRGGQQVEGESA